MGWGQHNLTPGRTSSIAVPIFRDGKFEAALSLIYFAAEMKQGEAVERYVGDMKATARLITAELSAAEMPDIEFPVFN